MQRLFFCTTAVVLLVVGACSDGGGGGSRAPSGMALDALLARRVELIRPCHLAINEVRLSMGSSSTWNVVQSRARAARRVCRGTQRMFETLQTPPDQPAAAAMRQQCSGAYQSALTFLNAIVRTNEARNVPDAITRRQSGVSRSRGSFENQRREVYLAIDACGRSARALDGSAPAEAPAEDSGGPT